MEWMDKETAIDGNEGASMVYLGCWVGVAAVLAQCEWICFFAGFVFHATCRSRASLAVFSRMNQLRSGSEAARIV
ncbi:hypothetical protein DIE14_33160 [Burkholderia sp. Bp9017]|nr:hypothetical protein DIE14_33160 [Burkholderia sp. Bp9017]